MAGAAEDGRCRAKLQDTAQIHDGDASAEILDHPQVVGDEDHGQPKPAPELDQQIEHLGLDRHVETGDRLVGHQHRGRDRKRAGDGDALALPARELEGIAQSVVGREPDLGQQPLDLRGDLPGRHHAMDAQGLGQSLADGHARVERGIGILKHHLDLPAQRPALAPAAEIHIPAAEPDAALVGPAQPDDEAAEGALAAARFADQAEDLAGIDGKGDLGHRRERLARLEGEESRQRTSDRVALHHAVELEDRASHGRNRRIRHGGCRR